MRDDKLHKMASHIFHLVCRLLYEWIVLRLDYIIAVVGFLAWLYFATAIVGMKRLAQHADILAVGMCWIVPLLPALVVSHIVWPIRVQRMQSRTGK